MCSCSRELKKCACMMHVRMHVLACTHAWSCTQPPSRSYPCAGTSYKNSQVPPHVLCLRWRRYQSECCHLQTNHPPPLPPTRSPPTFAVLGRTRALQLRKASAMMLKHSRCLHAAAVADFYDVLCSRLSMIVGWTPAQQYWKTWEPSHK